METASPVCRGPHRVEHIMGMPIGIDVRDPDADPAALDAAFDWLRWVDATFSTYRTDSEISRLNRGELDPKATHPDVRLVLERCAQLREETDGYFDAASALLFQWERLGDAALRLDAVDPSGLVKGWSVDRAAAILDAAGARNYAINAGGDIWVRGYAAPGQHWRVGIQHPLQHDRVAAVVEAADLAVATSGAYERGAHIVDPHSGAPPSGVLAVTITGPDLATADAYATAAFAMGRDGPAWTACLVALGYEALTILDDATVLMTPAFPRCS
jgi:thiamine biosynthesis lipoprotein